MGFGLQDSRDIQKWQLAGFWPVSPLPGYLRFRQLISFLFVLSMVMASPALVHARRRPKITAPSQVVLGAEPVSVKIQFRGEPQAPVVEASLGKIIELYRFPNGMYEAIWDLPDGTIPRLAVIAAWDDADPSRQPIVAHVQLLGKAELPVRIPQGTEVTLDIDGKKFGPVVSSDIDVAMVPVEVPPGVGHATAYLVSPDGSRSQAAVNLGVAPTARVAIFFSPHHVLGDGQSDVHLHVFAFSPSGSPTSVSAVEVNAGKGEVVRVPRRATGYYSTTYQIERAPISREITFAGNLDEEPQGWNTLNIQGIPPSTFDISLDPSEAVADGISTVKVKAQLSDGPGTPLMTGLPLRFKAEAGSFGDVKETSPGVYEVEYTTGTEVPHDKHQPITAYVVTPKGTDEVSREVDLVVTPGSPHNAMLKANPSVLLADGEAMALVSLAIQDANNNTVTDVAITVEVDPGEITEVRQAQPGTFTFHYTAPNLPRLNVQQPVSVQVNANGIQLQVMGRMLVGPEFVDEEAGIAATHGQMNVAAAAGLSALMPSDGFGFDALGPWGRIELSRRFWSGFYYTISPGFFRTSAQATLVDRVGLGTEGGALKADCSTIGVPLMAGAAYHWLLGGRLAIVIGLDLGAMFTFTSMTTETIIDEPTKSFDVLPAIAIPLSFEVLLGPGMVTVGFNHLRSLTSLGDGNIPGVHGAVVNSTGTLGYRLQL